MSAIPVPMPPEKLAVVPSDPSLWDRISNWVSENKAVVYTIAGVAVVVTTAGAVYYIKNSSVRFPAAHELIPTIPSLRSPPVYLNDILHLLC